MIPDITNLLLEIEGNDAIESALKLGIGAFSVLLFSLSIYGYKKTHLKKMIYASIAFSIFAAQLIFEFLQDSANLLDNNLGDDMFYVMTLAILVLFFLALVRKK